MRRTYAVLAITLAIAAITASVAAAGIHLYQFQNPSFTDNGSTLSATGAIAGLGNLDTTFTLTATGNPTATCTNPSGKQKPPGHNPVTVTLTGTQSIPKGEVDNGHQSFSVTTNAPVSLIDPNSSDFSCPNSSWTEAITGVAFTSATITVTQGGSLVDTISCTFSSPTSNGPVPANNVTCTETSH